MESLSKFYKDKRVLITGAQGFKGSWLCLTLNYLGSEVIGYGLINSSSLDLHQEIRKKNKNINFIEGNILDANILKNTFNKYRPEIVFHLAANPIVSSGYEDPYSMFETNIMGTVSILDSALKQNFVRSLVNITTDKVYKNNLKKDFSFTEEMELGGDDPYSASKACSELVTHAYRKSFTKKNPIGIATARAGNVIGIGDFSENRLFPDIMRAEIENKELCIRNPSATRPWQNVIDPIIGYLKLGQFLYFNPIEYSGSYNFGPENANIISVKELINDLINEKIISVPIKYIENNIPEKRFLSLSSQKAINTLNWSNKSNLIEEIKNIKTGYEKLINKSEIINYCEDLIINKIK